MEFTGVVAAVVCHSIVVDTMGVCVAVVVAVAAVAVAIGMLSFCAASEDVEDEVRVRTLLSLLLAL